MNNNLLKLLAATVGLSAAKSILDKRSGGSNQDKISKMAQDVLQQAAASFRIEEILQNEIAQELAQKVEDGEININAQNTVKLFRSESYENKIMERARLLLGISPQEFRSLSRGERFGKVVHARSLFEKAQKKTKKFPQLVTNDHMTVDDLIENIANGVVDQRKIQWARGASAGGKTRKQIQKYSSPQSEFNQSIEDVEEYSDKITSGIKAVKQQSFNNAGVRIQPGLLETLRYRKESIIFPSAFINYIRIAFGAGYVCSASGIDRDTSNVKFAYDDSYVFNPLYNDLGRGVKYWSQSCLLKMKILDDTINGLSNSQYPARTKNALKLTYSMVTKLFGDRELYSSIMQRYSSLRDKTKVPLDLIADLHLLVARFIYAASLPYFEGDTSDFFTLCDIYGQPLVPFGCATPDSYQDTLIGFLSEQSSNTFKYAETELQGARVSVSSGGEGPAQYIDGMGSYVDELMIRGWSTLLWNAKDSPEVREVLFSSGPMSSLYACDQTGGIVIPGEQAADYGDMDELTFSSGQNTMTYRDLWKWSVNGDIPTNDLSLFFVPLFNTDARKELFGSTPTVVIYSLRAKKVEQRFQSLKGLHNKILKLGLWMYESAFQLTRILNSGNITLAEYLLSPIMDIKFLDTRASRYKIRASEYPSHILSQMDVDKRVAVTSVGGYKSGYSKIKTGFLDNDKIGIRTFFNKILSLNKNGRSGGTPYNLALDKPFNQFMAEIEECPYPNMDWGKPAPPMDLSLAMPAKYIPGANDGIRVDGAYLCWPPNGDQSKALAKNTFKEMDPIEIRSLIFKLEEQGYVFDLLDADGKRRKIYKNYQKNYQSGYVKAIANLFERFRLSYGVSTQEISKAPFSKIFGLVFGGDEITSIISHDKNLFESYIKRRTTVGKEVPTQSLGYFERGSNFRELNMRATLKGLKRTDQDDLISKIKSEDLINSPTIILDLIENAINAAGVIGIPYTPEMNYVYNQNLGQMSDGSNPYDLFAYYRNNEAAARRENQNALEQNPTDPNSSGFVNFVRVQNLMVPEETVKNFSGTAGQTMERIHRAQSVYLMHLQDFCYRFSVGDNGREAFGDRSFRFKVSTVGYDIGILADDPLSFEKLYKEFSTHNGATLDPQTISLDLKVNPIDPDILRSKQVKSQVLTPVEVINCTRITSHYLVKRLCQEKAVVDEDGDIEYRTSEPLEMEIIRLAAPMNNLWENQVSDAEPELKEAWQVKYDKTCQILNENLDRVKALIQIYQIFKSKYPNAKLPVADFQNMKDSDIKAIVDRYTRFGPYQILEGVNYPAKFLDIVQEQLSNFKSNISKEAPSQYTTFDAEYRNAYESSYVARQSDKIGALVGVLPVGGGYRVYLPYTIEHLKNISRSTDTSVPTSSKIRDVKDSYSLDYSDFTKLCIGSNQHLNHYSPTLNRSAMHFVVVSPEGHFVWLNSIGLSSNKPQNFSDWAVIRNNRQMGPVSSGFKPHPTDWKQYKERELLSMVAIEYLIWLKGWLEKPTMHSGDRLPSEVHWMAKHNTNLWKTGRLYQELVSGTIEGGNPNGLPFEDAVRLGAELNSGGSFIPRIYSTASNYLGGTRGDIDFIESKFPEGNNALYDDMRKKARAELVASNFRWLRPKW